ncbi:unnamed protein product, partial [Meganyctiphanes norvegica]
VPGRCPDLFKEIGPGGCCYHFSEEIIGWSEARNRCHEFGELYGMTIHLLELGTNTTCCNDLEVMDAIASHGHNIWLGASDISEEGKWMWQHSSEPLSLSSTLWERDCPNGGTGQNCLIAWVLLENNRRAYLADEPCTNHEYHYVCQIFN